MTKRRRDRDVYVAKTPRDGVPEFTCEEVTGKYEGEELAAVRARRPTPERIAKVEVNLDNFKHEVSSRLTKVEIEVAAASGKLDVLPDLVSAVRDSVKASQQTQHVAEQDNLDAKKNWRARVTSVIAALLGGGLLAELLRRVL